jgi:hypothetical protein
MTERVNPLLVGLVALALGLVAGAAVLGDAVGRIRQGADAVEVTGSARRPIRADFVVWRVRVGAQEASLQPAYQRLKAQSDRLRAYLRGRGIADSVLTVQPVNVMSLAELMEGRETGRIAGYRLMQTFELRSGDVDGITRLSQEVTELINQGLELTPEQPEYLFTGLPRLRVDMLGEATADAKLRAEAIARGVGARVGAVRSVRVGVFQITPRYSTEVSDYGVNDTSSLEKDVTAVVRVTFAIR